ncbi:MAG: beta-ketoacyl synthase N-terminal-like domain-containing protein [Cyanobacteria bacterium P01_H01_bin.121]
MTQANPNNYQALLKESLLALKKMQAKLNQIESAQREPIAIIGMGCRFPGGVTDPESFWQLLSEGRDAITPVPESRWNRDAFYAAQPRTPQKMICREGGFLSDIECFDASFFNIAPREAKVLDPQQRLLLEVTWEALEQAQIPPDQLLDTQAGVFVGIGNGDYARLLDRAHVQTAHAGTGNSYSTAAGRLSYVLGLKGPSLAVDTACSSSLVAIHLACQSLRQQECELAIAAGVNLVLIPGTSVIFSQAGMLAPDGRCKTFDAAANGYVRSEGCGVIILKPLSAAQRDGDCILAVVRGSAVNHDGPSGGLTVPNGPAQTAVIQAALRNSKVKPEQVSYIEAHGTGTPLGDPIEIKALSRVFGDWGDAQNNQPLAPDRPLSVGSVKTNLGHTECAAGIAGVIKTVLQLQHQEIAPHLHFQAPNPRVDWSQTPVTVPTCLQPWTVATGAERLAGVSSFGFSGTNAHVILAEAPAAAPSTLTRPVGPEPSTHLLVFSAKTATGLKALGDRYCHYLQAHPTLALADICHSASTGRSHWHQRLAVMGRDAGEIVQKLQAWQQGQSVVGLVAGYGQNRTDARTAQLTTSLDGPESDLDLLTLRSHQQDWEQWLNNLAERYVQGEAIDWQRIARSDAAWRKVTLPTYPFQRKRYWLDAQPGSRAAPPNPPPQPALQEQDLQKESTGDLTSPKAELLEQLQAAAPDQHHQILLDYLTLKVAHFLEVTDSPIEIEQPLNTMGFDSLMATELHNLVQKDLGIDIPLQNLIEGISIAELANRLLEQFLLAEVSDPNPLTTDVTLEDTEEITL